MTTQRQTWQVEIRHYVNVMDDIDPEYIVITAEPDIPPDAWARPGYEFESSYSVEIPEGCTLPLEMVLMVVA